MRHRWHWKTRTLRHPHLLLGTNEECPGELYIALQVAGGLHETPCNTPHVPEESPPLERAQAPPLHRATPPPTGNERSPLSRAQCLVADVDVLGRFAGETRPTLWHNSDRCSRTRRVPGPSALVRRGRSRPLRSPRVLRG